MSQAKVDKYKKDKANRAKIMKKEKRMAFLEKGVLILVAAAIVGWIGFSVYKYGTPLSSSEETTTDESTDVNMTAINEFYDLVG